MFRGLDLLSVFVQDKDKELKYLIDFGYLSANSLSDPTLNTWTLLMYSVQSGSKRCTKLLLDYGCKVNYVDEDGQSALHKCGFYPHCVEMLLENGAEIEAKTNEGFTPLESYLEFNYRPESVQFLLLHGAKVENVKNIPTWVKEFDATLKKRVQECRKTLLALLFACNISPFRATREILLCIASQVWRLKEGEDAGPRAQGWEAKL